MKALIFHEAVEGLQRQFDLSKTKAEWGLYVFVCAYLCVFGPTGVWRGPRAQSPVQTHREGGREMKEEERMIKLEANWVIEPAQSETEGMFVEGGLEIRKRISAESWRNHKTCFMLATMKGNLKRLWQRRMVGGRGLAERKELVLL